MTLMVSFVANDAYAQQVSQGKFGQKFLTSGLVFEPGLLLNSSAHKSDERLKFLSFTHATMFRLALHQALTTEFMMSGEVDLGVQWLNDHSAQRQGYSDSELVFAYQFGIHGRWIPSGDLAGPSLGLGMHWFYASLKDAPAQILATDLRFGWLFWKEDTSFVILELGYNLPLVEGLSLPARFTQNTQNTQNTQMRTHASMDWSWQRFGLGIHMSF